MPTICQAHPSVSEWPRPSHTSRMADCEADTPTWADRLHRSMHRVRCCCAAAEIQFRISCERYPHARCAHADRMPGLLPGAAWRGKLCYRQHEACARKHTYMRIVSAHPAAKFQFRISCERCPHARCAHADRMPGLLPGAACRGKLLQRQHETYARKHAAHTVYMRIASGAAAHPAAKYSVSNLAREVPTCDVRACRSHGPGRRTRHMPREAAADSARHAHASTQPSLSRIACSAMVQPKFHFPNFVRAVPTREVRACRPHECG